MARHRVARLHMIMPALILIGVAAAALALWALVGTSPWSRRTRALLTALDAGRAPITPARYQRRELVGLPGPVQRYFDAVLRDGQPMVSAARIAHVGMFNSSADRERWRPFASYEHVTTRRPGFVWDARIAYPAGVPLCVHDAYVRGDGVLRAALFGVVPLAHLRGTHEIAEGELMRYLAEAAWYPTALLPSQGVRWTPVDEHSARASITDGSTTVALTFAFDEEGLIRSVTADARARTVGKSVVPTPWEGRWSRYESSAGMRVPTEGEVSWVVGGERRPYWRARVTSIAYDRAGDSHRSRM